MNATMITEQPPACPMRSAHEHEQPPHDTGWTFHWVTTATAVAAALAAAFSLAFEMAGPTVGPDAAHGATAWHAPTL